LVAPATRARLYNPGMEPGDFDEGAFFKAVERCGARALLIGRRALVSAVPEGVRTLLDRTLPADEFQRLLAVPLTDAERDDTRALVRWFTRRYPRPAERFAYIRRARARWLGRRIAKG
jgi:hypothetical protein